MCLLKHILVTHVFSKNKNPNSFYIKENKKKIKNIAETGSIMNCKMMRSPKVTPEQSQPAKRIVTEIVLQREGDASCNYLKCSEDCYSRSWVGSCDSEILHTHCHLMDATNIWL